MKTWSVKKELNIFEKNVLGYLSILVQAEVVYLKWRTPRAYLHIDLDHTFYSVMVEYLFIKYVIVILNIVFVTYI